MLQDGIRLGLSYQEKDFEKLLSRGALEGASFFKVTLPLLGKALDQALVSGQFNCPTNFSLHRPSRLPNFCYRVFNTIFEDSGALRDEPNLLAIQHLRQFLLFDSKLFSEPTEKQKAEAESGFRERMETLRKVKIPYDHQILQDAKTLLGFVLRNLSLNTITPGHGPGAVAEMKDHDERWDFTSWPRKAERYYPYMLYGASSISSVVYQGRGIPLSGLSTTRVVLVPKDFKGPRLISVEPAAMQYLQQGQMKEMMRYFRRSSLLSRSIRLEDQTFNREKAQESFRLGSATVDLSNASDTVSAPLVWFLLSELPDLRRRLFSTRSDYARLPSGDTVRLSAFAPMGSATCFPVETLVFWSLAMATLRLHRLHKDSGFTTRYLPWRELASSIAVFGDDIVIPSDALETFLSILRLVGCSPNMSKTCWKTPFRESCGGEWFSGTTVTIIRNKRYQYEDKKKITQLPILLDLQRKFFSKDYRKTSDLLASWAREIMPIYTRTFNVPPDGSLADICDDNRFCCAYGDHGSFDSGLRTRFNRDYQRLEVRIPSSVQPMKEWDAPDYPRLLASLLGNRVDRVAARDSNVRMAWHFMPAYRGLETAIEA